MVRQAGRHGWSTLDPVFAPFGDPERLAQAFMLITEVVEAADNIHACGQGGFLLDQATGAAGQTSQTLAEGGIQAFDVSRIDDATALRGVEQPRHKGFAALHNAAHDVQAGRRPVLDDLHDDDVWPRHQLGASRLAMARQRGAKGGLKGADIAGQPVDGQQERTTQGHAPDFGRPVAQSGCSRGSH